MPFCLCVFFFCRFYSVGRFSFIFLFTSRCFFGRTLAPCMLGYFCYSHFIAASFFFFFLLFLLLLCLQLLLPLLLYVRLLFGCRCFRKSHGVVSLFFFKCCHVLRLRFTNAVDGLTPPPLLFNFCIVIENRCDSSDTWH